MPLHSHQDRKLPWSPIRGAVRLYGVVMGAQRVFHEAACRCGSRLVHSERCPMHPRTHGERPYLGCDVMSRDDSVWLETRKRRRM